MENLSLTKKEFDTLSVALTQYLNLSKAPILQMGSCSYSNPDESLLEVTNYYIPSPNSKEYPIFIQGLYKAINIALAPSITIDPKSQHMIFTQADQATMELHLSETSLIWIHYYSGQE